MNIQVGDSIVVEGGSLFIDGMTVDIWGLSPILPQWVKSQWFSDYDRKIVGWFCGVIGRVGTIRRGSATIKSVDAQTNTIWFADTDML